MAKDMVANFLESYAYENNLVIWLSSTVLNDPQPVYNEDTGRWSVHVERTPLGRAAAGNSSSQGEHNGSQELHVCWNVLREQSLENF